MASPVPYQTYKSKRHSRNISNPYLSTSAPPPSITPPPITQAQREKSLPPHSGGRNIANPPDGTGLNGTLRPLQPPPMAHLQPEKPLPPHLNSQDIAKAPGEPPVISTPGLNGNIHPPSPISSSTEQNWTISLHAPSPIVGGTVFPLLNGNDHIEENESGGTDEPSTPPAEPKPAIPQRQSKFRHVPFRARSSLPSSPLRPAGTHSRALSTSSNISFLSEQQVAQQNAFTNHEPTHTQNRMSYTPNMEGQLPVPSPEFELKRLGRRNSKQQLPPRSASLARPKSSSPVPFPPSVSPAPSSTASAPASAPSPSLNFRPSAPYRPGFQPKGVYRSLTDNFTAFRQSKTAANKIERTKLERRLEKLIQLHFSVSFDSGTEKGKRPSRRSSSIFSLDFSDPGGLWKGVLNGQMTQGKKAELRAAEQKITPWQEDAEVSKCPLCLAAFHPLTNRKHHCRLCGKIICSLPVKRPQRPVSCSLLFVVDQKTRRIEEVGESVDYGVRRQASPNEKGKTVDAGEDDKSLKGVRICRDCRPVLSKQQRIQEVLHVPTFLRLYEAFIIVESEIQEALPQFKELIITLVHDDRPTKEAFNARKKLLEAFAQYDALAKRIRKLPCPAGPGSSQDRVQMAIMTRANLFLQKNMFPLQSLPKPKQPESTPPMSTTPQPQDQVASALQPLLEQEALLEAYVEEAKARRKFEDAKTLNTNLGEIRLEIDKILRNAGEDPQMLRNVLM